MNKSTKAWLLAGVVASVLSTGVNAKTFATSAAGVNSLITGDASLVQKVEQKVEQGNSSMAEANAFASTGNDFVVHSKVPEPETYALIGVGLLGLMLAHRRKYKENSVNSQISF